MMVYLKKNTHFDTMDGEKVAVEHNEKRLKYIDELSYFCCLLIETLSKEPLIYYSKACYKRSMEVDRYEYCIIIDILSEMSSKLLKIVLFQGLYGCTYRAIPKLEHFLYNGVNDKWVFDKEKILTTFQKCLDCIKTGWIKSSNKENPLIFHKEDDTIYYLFINKSCYYDIDRLIRFIVSVLFTESLSFKICTCFTLIRDNIDFTHSDTIFLYVKKNFIKQFDGKMKFGLVDLI